MRQQTKEAVTKASQKCDRLAARSLDMVFETAYGLILGDPLPENDIQPNARNLFCLALTYAVCAPMTTSAWILRQTAAIVSVRDEEKDN